MSTVFLRFKSKTFVGIFPIKNGIFPNKEVNFVLYQPDDESRLYSDLVFTSISMHFYQNSR
ncbi:hypothetical protein D1816_14560 [Aquimarina sp. AD10]|uniref:Uncharacterized protein n=1 Tax=Aquimarina aggregata TaxID=1642818 RepID=A0A162WLP2_9FLAO|nr:hypothetical protein D1816_14560 [Aquimarina sp. AD10]KZS38182.1 hypothetical protein AWE51_19275 [Aquimarina aggregata]RKM90007.1 hypothetical protein D7033_25080 [Aquimarina sp. AD10]